MLRVVAAAVIFVSAIGILGWRSARAAPTAGLTITRGQPFPQPALAASHLTHAQLAPGAACPATRPNGSGPFPHQLLDAEGVPIREWYGHGKAWVRPPHFPSSQRVHDDAISSKVPWYVAGPGVFRIVGRRIDGVHGTFRAVIPDTTPRRSGQVVETALIMSGVGCWDIAGTVGGSSVEWIYQPALPGRT